MKSYFLLVFFCAVYVAGDCQVAIQNNQLNLLYLGQPNPLTIAVGGYNANDVSVQTNNGKIKAGSMPGAYIITPTVESDAKVEVFVKTPKGSKLVGSQVFSVKTIPLTAVRIDSNLRPGPSMPLVSISHSPMVGLNIVSKWTITRFECSVFRNGDQIFNKTFSNRNGVNLDYDSKQFMRSLKKGDIICLDNIMARDPKDETLRNLSPLKYRIAQNDGAYKQQNDDPDIMELVDPITGKTVTKKITH
jgi:GldM C-terminal domain